ncbi:MAG: RpiB/LacA/LacB family sugar-phosphate isomerase [Oscillospiraceae bacterium]|jgi:ribose 5-phosphate isomerase B|nr:RpiB/LacA/LacB family sugar-phosphate isomerase [Oscillospiraceae bacterium]
MVISVGSDHCGYRMKLDMIPRMREWGYEIIDNGCHDDQEPVYFPGVAQAICQPILDGRAEKAIMFCGTGVGASVACNKIPGIRASIIHDVHCAHQAVEHDDVQVMCLGAQIVGDWLAPDLIHAFLTAKANQDEWTANVVRMLGRMDGSIPV